jgi:hypothetical protein
VSEVLQAAQAGDREAMARLLPLVYAELHQLAQARMARQPPGQTLQTTALVHEACLHLVGKADLQLEGRAFRLGPCRRPGSACPGRFCVAMQSTQVFFVKKLKALRRYEREGEAQGLRRTWQLEPGWERAYRLVVAL